MYEVVLVCMTGKAQLTRVILSACVVLDLDTSACVNQGLKVNAGACLQGTKFAGANKQQLAGSFAYLESCLEQIVKDNELGALRQALKVHVCFHRVPGQA